MTEPKIQFKWYDALLLAVIPPAVAWVIRLLMGSCRLIRVEGKEREKEVLARSHGKTIYPAWHQRMSYLGYYLRASNIAVMISQSRDGEYAARVVERLGYKTIRGSTTRGGTTALRVIIKTIKDGYNGGMLADGPLGPPRVAKIGSVIMARNAEVPISPVVWGADRCWVLNSWDRFLIPKPFARVVVYIAEPILVPRSVKGKGLEPYRRLLEDRLNQGARWCDEQFGDERPWRKVTEEGMPEIGAM